MIGLQVKLEHLEALSCPYHDLNLVAQQRGRGSREEEQATDNKRKTYFKGRDGGDRGRRSPKASVSIDHHEGDASLSPLLTSVLIYNQSIFILLSPIICSIGVLPYPTPSLPLKRIRTLWSRPRFVTSSIP